MIHEEKIENKTIQANHNNQREPGQQAWELNKWVSTSSATGRTNSQYKTNQQIKQNNKPNTKPNHRQDFRSNWKTRRDKSKNWSCQRAAKIKNQQARGRQFAITTKLQKIRHFDQPSNRKKKDRKNAKRAAAPQRR